MTFTAVSLQHKIHNTSLLHHFELCSVKSFALLYSTLAFSPFWLLKLGMGVSSVYPSFLPIIRLYQLLRLAHKGSLSFTEIRCLMPSHHFNTST